MVLYDYTAGHYIQVDALLNEHQVAPTSEESFAATAFGALLVAGVSKVVTLILESKGAVFAPNLFITSMVIGELVAEFIVKIATDFKPQTPDLLPSLTVAQFIIALPVTLLTNCALALAFGSPIAFGSVILATIASFVALRVAILAATVLLIALIGALTVITA